MIKVYQTIVDKNKGNCMQAALASLFEKELEEVPNFIEHKDNWWTLMDSFYIDNGYSHITPFNVGKREIDLVKTILKHDNGVNVWCYEQVCLVQTFKFSTNVIGKLAYSTCYALVAV